MTAPLPVLEPPYPNIGTVGRRAIVREPFWVHDLARGRSIYVPADPEDAGGDGASIPRLVPGWIIQPNDCGEVPPRVHDLLYRTGGLQGLYSRKEADQLFLELMALDGVTWWRRHAAYRAVRLFGRSSWRPSPSRAA